MLLSAAPERFIFSSAQQQESRKCESGRQNEQQARTGKLLLTGMSAAGCSSRWFCFGRSGFVVASHREVWFSDNEASVADETTPEWISGSVKQNPVTPAVPATKPAKHIAAAKSSAQPAAADSSVAVTRNVIPPLEVEVVAGNSRNTVHLSTGGSVDSKAARRAPATLASQRVTLENTSAPQPTEPAYPLLGRQMKVQGSVLLQALIAADGTIRDLRVLSGPAILASAAREAAQRWQFKPTCKMAGQSRPKQRSQ